MKTCLGENEKGVRSHDGRCSGFMRIFYAQVYYRAFEHSRETKDVFSQALNPTADMPLA